MPGKKKRQTGHNVETKQPKNAKKGRLEGRSPGDGKSGTGRSTGARTRPNCIVGIGASAGGLEAFEQLLKALPPNTGMGFVLVQHLAPQHESILSELLAKST